MTQKTSTLGLVRDVHTSGIIERKFWPEGRIRRGEALLFPNLATRISRAARIPCQRRCRSSWPRQLPDAFREYIESERRQAERYLGSVGRVEWLASFAPIGPAELRGFVFDTTSPAELDDGLVEELALGLSLALGLYAELGFQSFNFAVHGATSEMGNDQLVLRIVARAYFGSLLRSDAMWSERLHWEAAVDLAPETVAELGRMRFARVA